MVIDLGASGTQEEFAELVGISQPAVSMLAARGILAPGSSLGDWLLAYCEHLRGIAAGRGGDGGLELAAERAALAREQREKIAMQNAVTRRELAPARLIEEILARTASRVARVLDTIPGEVRRRLPSASADDIQAVAGIVAKARNVIAALRRADLFGDLSSTDAEAQDLALESEDA